MDMELCHPFGVLGPPIALRDFVVSTYLAKYLNILCHLSLDTLPFMSTYFLGSLQYVDSSPINQ